MNRPLSCRYLGTALAAIFIGCSGCSPEPTDAVESGKAFASKGDYASAIIQFKNAVGTRPDDAELRYALASALTRSTDLVAAEIEYRKAISLGINKDEAVPELVRVLLTMGKSKEALDEISAIQPTTPKARARLLALKGDALLMTKDVPGAREAYAESLRVSNSDPVARVGQARLAVIDGNASAAEALLEGVLKDAPGTPDAWFLKANLLLSRNDVKGATSAFDEAIAHFPADLRSYTAIVPALLRLGDIDGAEARSARISRIAPGTPTATYLNALVAYSKGNKASARDSIRAVMKVIPDDPRVLVLAASLEYETGNLATAERYLTRVVASDPSDTEARKRLVSSRLGLGNAERAKEALIPLIKDVPSLDKLDEPTLAMAGVVHVAVGEVKTGIGFLERAVQLNGKSYDTLVQLGKARLVVGDAVAGVRDLESAIALDANRVDAYEILVSHFVKAGSLKQATEIAERLGKVAPTHPGWPNAMGIIAMAKRDVGEARTRFASAVELSPTHLPAVKNLVAIDLAQKNHDEAVAVLKRLLAKEPGQTEAVVMLAGVLRQKGAPRREVIEILDSAIAANREAPALWLAKIDYMNGLRDIRAALDTAQEAQAVFPEDPRVLFALARAQQAVGDAARASATYGSLVGLVPNSIAPLIGQVELYLSERNWGAARTAIEQAIRRFPDNVEARILRAEIAVKSGQLAEARAAARDIQTRWPNAPAGYQTEFQALIAAKETALAERVLRDGLKRTGDALLATRLISFLVSQDRIGDAEAEVNAWLAQHPTDHRVLSFAGGIRMSRGEFAQAIEWFRKAERISPEDAGILNNLAWSLGRVNDRSSLEIANRALARAPKDPAVLDTVGVLTLQFGSADRAVEYMERAVALAPDSASIRVNLARGLARLNRTDDARSQLDKALQLNPGATLRKDIEDLRGSL